MAAQGAAARPRLAWEFTRQGARSLIELDSEAVHPELDIVLPGGAATALIRVDPGDSVDHEWTEPVAHVHDASGRWLGSITCERLAQLRRRWEHARANRPEVFERLQAGSFEEEVAGLLLSWRARTRKLKATELYNTYCEAPSAIVEAVRAATGADTELFASPLDVHPGMAAYYSTEERDQLFGASMGAYSCTWAGACYAHPPEAPGELEKAVRWALASAKEAPPDRPVLTVMLLLGGTGSAPYTRWLQYQEADTLASF